MSSEDTDPLPTKVAAVLDFPKPKTVKELRRYVKLLSSTLEECSSPANTVKSYLER